MACTTLHVPRTPHPRFVGATSLGPRGDVIAEADWCVGELVKTLEEEGLLENTLSCFRDNGPVLNDGYYDDAVEKNGNHTASGVLRGGNTASLKRAQGFLLLCIGKERFSQKIRCLGEPIGFIFLWRN